MLTANSSALRNGGIKKALPPTEEEALVYLYMQSAQRNKEAYLTTLNDFIATFPQSAEGYLRRAALYIDAYKDEVHYALAEHDVETAMSLTETIDVVHFELSKLSYITEL